MLLEGVKTSATVVVSAIYPVWLQKDMVAYTNVTHTKDDAGRSFPKLQDT